MQECLGGVRRAGGSRIFRGGTKAPPYAPFFTSPAATKKGLSLNLAPSVDLYGFVVLPTEMNGSVGQIRIVTINFNGFPFFLGSCVINIG